MSVELSAGEARVRVEPDHGCRLTSLEVHGHELLVTEGDPPFGSGTFVMAPWAGRIRDGQARWGGSSLDLERWIDGHAIHGTVHSRAWEEVADRTWEVSLPEPWFAPARVRQHVDLRPDRLDLRLELHATDRPVPATIGWHPWFRRRIAGSEPRLELVADWILERDPDGIASQRRIPPPPGPWDDTFGDIDWPVRLTWPDVLELTIVSDGPVAVVFTEPEEAVCIEPQSGPPDEINHSPRVIEPGAPLVLTTTWRWLLPLHA